MKVKIPFADKIHEASKNRLYIEELKKPVWDNAFLLEGGQGKNINGNAFALLRCIRSQAKYDDHEVYFSVMPDMYDKAEERMSKYGLENVRVVINGSDTYKKALARAKYLITDNSFTPYFVKRDDQVYLNTWHGTPLKALGRTDLRNTLSLANVQANMLKADYLLHPNHFTRDIMMKDYMVDRLFRHRTVILDYPRNDALYKEEFRSEISGRYDLEGKRLIAYMPTWRGAGRTADTDEQIAMARGIIEGLSCRLNDDEMLCVNLHFLLGQNIDVTDLPNVMLFPPEYETYDFLALCDVLITDYSSVSIDFAGTGKDIILYLYDYEQYKADKGFYIDVKTLPFLQAEDMDGLERCLHSGKAGGYALDSSLLCEDRGDSARKVIELMTGGTEIFADASASSQPDCDRPRRVANSLDLEIDSYDEPSGTHLIYFGNIRRKENRQLLGQYTAGLTSEEKRHTVIAFENVLLPETVDILETLDADLDFVRIQRNFYKNTADYISTAAYKKTGIMKSGADSYYAREAKRLLEYLNLDVLELVMFQSIDRAFIISKAPARTVLYRFPEAMYPGSTSQLFKRPALGEDLAAAFDEASQVSEPAEWPADELSQSSTFS